MDDWRLYGKCIVQEFGSYADDWERDYPDLKFVTIGAFPNRFHVWAEHLYDEKYGFCRRCGAATLPPSIENG